MSDGKHKGLYLRALSAAILAPVVLFCLIYGGCAFLFMMLMALTLSCAEWWDMAKRSPARWVNAAAGIIYIVLCMAAFVYLREYYANGTGLALALLLCIWASDSGAYFTGKAIGGPKMAPKISPNKTWAGLIGGMVSSAVVFALYVFIIGPFFSDISGMNLSASAGISHIAALLIGASITISGQAGDLLISMQKRAVGVKDTGAIIPGHGGILDRIDSVLLAGPVFLLTLMAVLS